MTTYTYYYQCSRPGSPSVLGQGEDGRHYVLIYDFLVLSNLVSFSS